MSFYYRYAMAETTEPWDRPTWDNIDAWWDEFKLVDGVEDYDFYVVGGVLYDITNTWDCDINFIGEIKDIYKLENILNQGRQIGFKYNILIDIYWLSSIRYCYDEISEENRRYYFRATIEGDEIKIKDGIKVVDRVIFGQKLNYFNVEETKVIIQSLYYPAKKHLNKPKGYNNNKPILLKK